ncbi:30S ribosomal protein S7 [Candidatus Dojkabacteria bacterium]|nr:30S ribosomal protein S7 [Candidatus Dojkabacteria bacterium]
MRGKRAKHRKPIPDVKYQSVSVERLINRVMQGGKKTQATKAVYYAMEQAASKLNESALVVLERSLNNIKPVVELRSRRVGGANYSVPVPVTEARQETLAIRWLVETARTAKGIKFRESLLSELVAAYNGSGEAVKKREGVEKMAEANRAFAHFKW